MQYKTVNQPNRIIGNTIKMKINKASNITENNRQWNFLDQNIS